MRCLSPAFALAAFTALATASAPAFAQDDAEVGPSKRDIVVAYNTGFHWGISPGIFIPTGGGNLGFSLAGSAGYGVETGPVIVVPGGQIAGFFPSGTTIFTAMATGRVVYPLGGFAPFVEVGGGPGVVTTPSTTGLALMGGGGFMYHFSTSFALGAQANYQTISGTGFQVLSIGPILALAL